MTPKKTLDEIRQHVLRSAGNGNVLSDYRVQYFAAMIDAGEATLKDFQDILGDGESLRRIKTVWEVTYGRV